MKMKKIWAAVVAAGTVGAAAAGGIPYGDFDGLLELEWTPLQISLVPAASLVTSATPVYGVSIGLYAMTIEDRVVGLNFAPLATATRKTTGLTLSLVNLYDENRGVALGVVNVALHDGAGVQLGVWNQNISLQQGGFQFGLVNVARYGWQFGLVNVNQHPNALLPWTLFFNYCPEMD